MHRAVITGGTAGIGAEFARQLAGRGVDLVLVARDGRRLAGFAAELREGFGVEVEELAADLADRRQAQRVADRLGSETSPVSILVNNAGFSVGTPLTRPDMDVHDRAAEVMLRSVVLLSGAAAQAMMPRRQGWIINVSSIAGLLTQSPYSAFKAWMITHTESLATQLHGTGVGATAVCPGWVRTEFHQRAGISGSSIPGWLWLDVATVVREGLDAAARGRVVSVPSSRFAAIYLLLRHAPRTVVRWLSRTLSTRRAEET